MVYKHGLVVSEVWTDLLVRKADTCGFLSSACKSNKQTKHKINKQTKLKINEQTEAGAAPDKSQVVNTLAMVKWDSTLSFLVLTRFQ